MNTNSSLNNKERIYMDYAASTPVAEEVMEAMYPFFSNNFANPSSSYKEGRLVKKAIEESRVKIATILGAQPNEIIFTSGGTESNNLAIIGSYNALHTENKKDFQIMTSEIEHPSVMEVFESLGRRGVEIAMVGVNSGGLVDLQKFRDAISGKTRMVSIMLVNSEIGVIEPIAEIANIIKEENQKREPGDKIIFHTDSAQAPLYLDVDVNSLGVDMLSLDAQKVYGPKGVGMLFKRDKTPLSPIMFGGSQEKRLRPGTPNVAGIIGLEKALSLASENKKNEIKRMCELQEYFIKNLSMCIPKASINGSLEKRIPNNINISISGYESEYLVIALDELGISAASRSACLSGGGEGSYVVKALGEKDREKSAVRFSMGKDTTKADIDNTINSLSKIISIK